MRTQEGLFLLSKRKNASSNLCLSTSLGSQERRRIAIYGRCLLWRCRYCMRCSHTVTVGWWSRLPDESAQRTIRALATAANAPIRASGSRNVESSTLQKPPTPLAETGPTVVPRSFLVSGFAHRHSLHSTSRQLVISSIIRLRFIYKHIQTHIQTHIQ